jgi:hypothetical protein
VLALGDGLALVAFILVGLSRHNAFTTAVFVRNAVPFLVIWPLAGLMFKAYSRPGVTTLLVTWAVGVPIAVLARSMALGHPTGGRFFEFLGVTLLMTAIFVGGWRLIAAGLARLLHRNPSGGPAPAYPPSQP